MKLVDRLAAALAESEGSPGSGPTDDRLDAGRPGVPAAVLVAVTDRPEPGVLLTRRHAALRAHAGQIAFPGGRADPEDRDAAATALREAEEEIALPAGMVEVAGLSDPYFTHSGYDIVPVIGVIPPDLPLVPNPVEVDDMFEVPLGFLLGRANHGRGSIEHGGVLRHIHELTWRDRRIWGITAGIIVNLSRRLAGIA